MPTRYTITHVSYIFPNGVAKIAGCKYLRTLSNGNCGKAAHFDTRAEAEKHLAAIRQQNAPDRLRATYGDHWETLRVDSIPCYDHGEAKATCFGSND